MSSIRKLPIGIQDFSKIRTDNYVYVDKTRYVYKLVSAGCPCFLSRPRRFGKSLLLSTLRAYWEGKKELFEGLEIYSLTENDPEAWQAYPVFYFDLNRDDFSRENALEEVLGAHLTEWEKIYGSENPETSLAIRFQNLLIRAYEQTGKQCVVLIDEYDKPLLDAAQNEGAIEHNRSVFRGFFSALKSYDHYLKFVFMTGVTKFSKVSIFSDLNHLMDISLNKEYSCICGITQDELMDNFMPELQRMSLENDNDISECISELKEMYDGYHFCFDSPGVYNPFSLLNALAEQEYGTYWFSTGTPYFLIDKLKDSNFDIRRFTDGTVYVDDNILSDYRIESNDPVPLLYQTGYLTIVDYDRRRRRYSLSYPNNEVKYGFLKSLAPIYLRSGTGNSDIDIFAIDDCMENGNMEDLKDIFTSVFSSLPYTNDSKPTEQNFQNVIYIIFMMLGKFVYTEVHSSLGRADCIVKTSKYIYIFEFKRDSKAEEAIAQINEKGYARPFAADARALYKIGVNFDSKSRNITGWIVDIENA